ARATGTDHATRAAPVAASPAADAGRPRALIARTLKGKGVSFMEHPAALADGGGTYRWHAGAPDDESFARAVDELVARIRERVPDPRLVPPAPAREGGGG